MKHAKSLHQSINIILKQRIDLIGGQRSLVVSEHCLLYDLQRHGCYPGPNPKASPMTLGDELMELEGFDKWKRSIPQTERPLITNSQLSDSSTY